MRLRRTSPTTGLFGQRGLEVLRSMEELKALLVELGEEEQYRTVLGL